MGDIELRHLPDLGDVSHGDSIVADVHVTFSEVGESSRGAYLKGTLTSGLVSASWKMWNGPLFDKSKNEDLSDGVRRGLFRVDVWKDKPTLVVEDLSGPLPGVSPRDLIQSPYDLGELLSRVDNIKTRLSDSGLCVFNHIWNKNHESFEWEYAAITHHDNVPHGLLAHSVKVTEIMLMMIDTYPALAEGCDTDVLILGAFFHDLGKCSPDGMVGEYSDGAMSDFGKLVSHRFFGPARLYDDRLFITDLLGEENFWRLVSVLHQHHGQYEERPHTVEAYVVHLCDSMEASITDVSEALPLSGGARLGGFFLR